MSASFDRGKAFRVFEQALGTEDSERAAFVSSACGDDPALRHEVDALLEAAGGDQAQTGVLLGPALRAREDLVGRSFGRFRLVELIGEGGMGVVYRAERTDGIGQVVAVKLIGSDLGERGRERFLRETQLLARLEHPAIARLIDAGVDQDRAWIALEFVPGQPIDAYCEARRLPLRARVQLLTRLAGAVAAAHGMLVVHRDIKPANVLVTPDGSPKLIDFGIATLLGEPGAAHQQTVDVARLFTPHYAAPEQVAGEPVTVATDVFGLGALGYRLLSGHALHSAARGAVGYLLAITEQDVVPPSRIAAQHGDEATARALRGDLDAILCKALERQPSRRYASAAELQADLQRYLDEEPVRARPPSLGIRLGKFARRNRTAVAVATVLAFVVIVSGVLYEQEVQRADEAREIAVRRGEFLAHLLNSADPRRGGNRDVTVAQLLDQSVPQLDAMVDSEPLAAASMFNLLAQTDLGLGRYTEGLAASARALQVLRSHAGPPTALADVLIVQGELLVHASRNRDAEQAFQEALRLVEPLRNADRPLADALEGLGKSSDNLGKEAQAEAFYNREIAVQRRSHVDFGGKAAFPLGGLGTIRYNQGRYREASAYVAEAVAIARRYFPPDSPDLLDTEYNYAMTLEQDHRAAEAEPVFRGLLDSYRRILGPDHSETFGAQQGLAHDLMSQGRYQEAADEALAAAQGLSRTLGDKDGWTQTAWGVYGLSACLAGRADEGLEALRRVAVLREAGAGADHWRVSSTHVQIGTCLIAAHRYAEAEPLLIHAAGILEKNRGPHFDRTQAAYKALHDLYSQTGRAAEAGEWQAKLLTKGG